MKKIKMRIFAGFLALCLLAGLLPATARAAGSETQTDEQSWADCVTAPPDGYQDDDSGSSVKISSAEGLAWFARLVNQGDSFAGKTVVLTNSLDLSAHQWVPIGTSQHPFAGTFDGKGNTISGMTMAVSEAVPLAGLFGVVSTAAIQNVVLAESTVSGSATSTKEAACELKIGGIAATNTEKIPVTVKNCTVELSVTLATTGYVTVNIGGVLGYVEDWTGSYATITDTNVSLSMQQTAEEGFYRTMAGAAIGSLNNSKNTTTIQNCSLSLSGTMTGSGFISGYPSGSTAGAVIQIGGAVGVTPTTGSGSEPPVVLLERTSCDSTLDFTGAEETLESFTTLCDTEIGGFFGRASYSTIRSSFAKMELKSQTENGYFGNIAGNWADIREAEWSNVYTYAVQAGKQCTRPVHTTNPNWPKAQDVYYIVPNELTEHQSGVPFSYQTYDNDNYKTTPGINDGFTYSDGDAEDGITVTPSADGKMVTIAPANEQCAVRGVLELSSGYTVGLVLPVPVYPVGGGTYAITCEAKDLTSSGYTSCKVTTAPEGKAQAGDLVTITAKPIPKDIKLVDSVTVTTSDGTPVAVEKTTGSIIGDQTYTFTMPASDVTVTGVFRKSSTEFTLSSNPVEFYVYEGYTSDDVEPITVTITNTGDLDVTFEGKYALPTSEYYDIQPADGPWRGENGREITIQPGGTATFTVVPNPGLTSDFNPNTVKPVFYSTEQERVYLSLHCTVTEAPTYMFSASPASLTFEALYEGETPSVGKTVTLSNTGTGSLDVQLPTSEHFEVIAGDGWSGGTASLAPGENATVTITPKGRLSIGAYTDSIRFTTNHSATYVDVTASFTVLQHEDIRITPANITVYTGGEGYTGMVDDSGNLGSTTNGLPEPGYYITLPEALNEQLGGADHAADLSDILTLTYDDGNGTTREWKLELYGTDAHSTDVEGGENGTLYLSLAAGCG